MMTRAGRELLDEKRSENLDPKLPWGGRSPRALTTVDERIRLRREATRLEEKGDDSLVEEQCRRHLHGW